MIGRPALSLAALIAIGCSPSSPESTASSDNADTASVIEVQSFGDNPGKLKMYEYAPQNLAPNAPVVLVMHGCMQGAPDAANTGWNTLADELGFLAVYPEQQSANNSMRCFNWAGEYGDPANLERGKGENQSIKEMVDTALQNHHGDPKRVYILGFSGGGGMAALMAAVWPEVFAGGATLAGIPYDCTTKFLEVSTCLKPGMDRTPDDWGSRVRNANPNYAGTYPPMSFWQGSADSFVAPTNRTQLIRQWTDVQHISDTPTASETVEGATHSLYKDSSGHLLVESYEVTGMDHGVPIKSGGKCGAASQYTLDAGICAARHIADFFGLTAH
jgi:poly(hydroxyalkanoate) depolymerase family esterase